LACDLDAEARGDFGRWTECEEQNVRGKRHGEGKEGQGKLLGERTVAEDGDAVYKDGPEERAESPHDEMIVSGEIEVPGGKSDSNETRDQR
jgi:hypothetical protein